MVPERQLDEYQLEVLRKCGVLQGANQWIQGFAGSGKSVLVIHAVQRILAANPGTTVCVAVYTHALKQLLASGLAEKYRNVPVMTHLQLLNKSGSRYDVLVVDEVQDIPSEQLTRLRAMADRLIVAGDADQSIYEQSGRPDDVVDILKPEVYRLTTIHRLTKRLIDIVRTILPGAAIEGARTGRMQEVQVTLAKADRSADETEWVWQQCCRYSKHSAPAAVLFPSHDEVQSFMRSVASRCGVPAPVFRVDQKRNYDIANNHFQEHGVPLRYLGNSFGDLEESDTRPLTYVMTYHSAKGLDFNTVFLPTLNSGQTFWRGNEDISRRLFFVASTRSRCYLFLSYSSAQPHSYVMDMPQHLLHKQPCSPSGSETALFEDIPF